MDKTNIYLNNYDEILKQMIKGMTASKITGNITKDFINTMIPHHRAAIFMAKNLLTYGNYEPLLKIAQKIITVQTQGIKEMQMILQTTKGYNNTFEEVTHYLLNYNEIFQKMIRGMENAPRYSNINLDFTYEMIPHHEGAIAMCQNLLNYRIDSSLKNLALNIIKFQSNGVKELKEIQNNLKNQS